VVVDDRSCPFEPERRQLRQDLALVRNSGCEDVIERGQAIGGDNEQRLAELTTQLYRIAGELAGE